MKARYSLSPFSHVLLSCVVFLAACSDESTSGPNNAAAGSSAGGSSSGGGNNSGASAGSSNGGSVNTGGSSNGGSAGDAGQAGSGASTTGGSGGSSNATVFFHEHVESILQQKCQVCHQDGGIAPFSLMDYPSAKAWAPLMVTQTQAKTMPPWAAFDTDTCQQTRPWRNDHRLTDAELQTLSDWFDQGSVEGNPANAPAPVDLSNGHLSGATDALAPANEHFLGAGTQDELRCFILDPGFTEETWLDGYHVVPGDPRVVHHVLVFSDPNNQSVNLDEGDGSYDCFGGVSVGDSALLAAWAPGGEPMEFPSSAMRLPAGSKMVMQVHYHRLATEDTHDSTTVEFRRVQQKPEYEAIIALVGNFDNIISSPENDGLLPGEDDPPAGSAFVIPANKKDHWEKQQFYAPDVGVPLILAGVASHMHWVGVDMRIAVERADQSHPDECLLDTPKYDFSWQRMYWYDTAIADMPKLYAGDRITLDCKFDNTMDNPRVVKALQEQNMVEPTDVYLGESTLEEMCLGAFVVLVPAGPLQNFSL